MILFLVRNYRAECLTFHCPHWDNRALVSEAGCGGGGSHFMCMWYRDNIKKFYYISTNFLFSTCEISSVMLGEYICISAILLFVPVIV